jgi:hypothetical protein
MNTIGKAAAIALTVLSVSGASLAQKYKYTPPPPKVSAPKVSAPKVSTPKASAPRSAPRSAPARSAPQRSSQPARQSRSASSRSSASSQARSQAASQRAASQAQARQQRTQAKQLQQQQKAQAKQQQQQQKLQARQQKEQAKQQQKQQQALAKQQKHSPKAASQSASAPHSAAPAAASQPSASRGPASAAYHVPENGVAGKTPAGATTLTKDGSQAVVGQLNSSRTHMSGINARPLPAGDITVHPNGHLTLATAGGQQYGLRPNGTVSSFHDGQNSATFNNRGMVSSLHTPNLSVSRGVNGGRTIVTHAPDGSRIVSFGPHSGYVESNVVVGGRPYIQRTAIINRQIVTTRYYGYSYGGVMLHGFVAPFYFSPGFYGYAYNPWADPLAYDFGWAGEPWYGGPNPYFGAYAVYPSAAYWLTDYIVGQTLSGAFQMREDALSNGDADYAMDASASDGMNGSDDETLQANANTPISSDVKEQIAQEVKDQIEIDKENAAAQAEQVRHDELVAALSQANHVFVVSSDLGVITDKGQNCGLQAGDVLRVVAPPAPSETIVQLQVAASKRADCPAGVAVGVALEDLQEMQNAFHSQVESGLGTLIAHQGDGIPAAPLAAVATKPQPSVDGPPPVPADELASMLDQQRQQADQAEAQIKASVQ